MNTFKVEKTFFIFGESMILERITRTILYHIWFVMVFNTTPNTVEVFLT